MSQQYRIALIDDNTAEHKYFSLLVRLKKLPLSVVSYSNPLQAIEALNCMSEDEFPHVIISDIKMPLMDGFEFSDIFYRNFHENHPQTLLFICSSSRRLEDIEQAKEHPAVSGFVEKPFTKEKIQEHILDLLNDRDSVTTES